MTSIHVVPLYISVLHKTIFIAMRQQVAVQKKANGRRTQRVIQISVLRALVYFDQINHLAIDHLFASVLKVYCDICANN